MGQQAFQDILDVENHCWGCGSHNEHGLQVKSYWSGDEAVCTWQAKNYHAGGARHILNGGIIATIIDCHSTCTAIAAAYRAEGREFGADPLIWYVTGSLQVTYLRPTLIKEPIVLRARVKKMEKKKAIVTCSLFAKGEECARGEVVAVRVSKKSWGGP
ncbi:MAG: PaaI family thioesterase [Deltaproteobacteria bacterium]|nr:PaaI family thioesterase [Deltaproteobacteria bacterium]